MNLDLGEEVRAVADLARNIGVEVLAPAAREAEAERAVPESVWNLLFETGLTTPVPEELGGEGVPDPLTRLTAVENLACGDPGITLAAIWSGAAAGLIAAHGSAAQQGRLRELASDKAARGSVAIYEGFGRGVQELETTIEVAGEVVRVVGAKVGVAFGSSADPLVVIGRDRADGRTRAVIVTATDDGVSPAPAHRSLGLDAAGLSAVSFDVTTSTDALLGGPDANEHGIAASVNQLRLLVAAALIGTAERAIRYASDYATTRIAFGSPIASFQGVSFPLAEALMRLDAARLEVSDVTIRLTEGGSALDGEVAQALAYASTVALKATRDAVQTLGGHGFIQDHPVEIWYRSAATLAALDFDPACSAFHPAL